MTSSPIRLRFGVVHESGDNYLDLLRRWVSDERLYALLDQVVAHPQSSEGSGDTRDRKSLQIAEIAARETLSPVERLEMALHPRVGFVILPLFAFANAGLTLSTEAFGSTLTLAVFAGLVFGKPLGILMFSYLAVLLGVAARAPDLNWRLVAGGGMLAGIGFTMALFIADLSLPPVLTDSAKMGIFAASGFSAMTGMAFLLWATSRGNRSGPGGTTASAM